MGILDEAKEMSQIDASSYFIKAFLAGHSGSGKTRSAVTTPSVEGKTKLIIDFDHRSETVAGIEGVKVLDCYEVDPKSPKAWTRAHSIKNELWSLVSKHGPEGFPYSSVVADGLTSMGRYSLNYATLLDPKRGLGGFAAKQHYLPQMHELANWVMGLLPLPCHVIVTGHMDLVEAEDGGESFYVPKITGKLKTEVSNWFNECFYCYRQEEVVGDKRVLSYYWLTKGSGKWEFFKSALNQDGKYWDDPIKVDLGEADAGFAKLLKLRYGGKE